MTHSFPTRRSADLPSSLCRGIARDHPCRRGILHTEAPHAFGDRTGRAPAFVRHRADRRSAGRRAEPAGPYRGTLRSEEHTSELQSLMRISYAVFFFKKKTAPHLLLSASTQT